VVRRILAERIVAQFCRLTIATIVPIYTPIAIALCHTHSAQTEIVSVVFIHAERGTFFGFPVLVGTTCSNIIRREFPDIGGNVLSECADVVGKACVARPAAC